MATTNPCTDTWESDWERKKKQRNDITIAFLQPMISYVLLEVDSSSLAIIVRKQGRKKERGKIERENQSGKVKHKKT